MLGLWGRLTLSQLQSDKNPLAYWSDPPSQTLLGLDAQLQLETAALAQLKT